VKSFRDVCIFPDAGKTGEIFGRESDSVRTLPVSSRAMKSGASEMASSRCGERSSF